MIQHEMGVVISNKEIAEGIYETIFESQVFQTIL